MNSKPNKNKCISCKSIVDHCLDLGSIPLVNNFQFNTQKKKYPLSMGLCRECKLLQIEKNINPKKLFTNYAHISSGSQYNLEHLREVFEFLCSKKLINRQTKILEIGCNDGSFLKIAKTKTKKIVGVDPARNLIKNIASDYLELIPDFFNKKNGEYLLKKYQSFDVIVALNVIPHTINVADILKYVGKLLNPNGLFLMECAYFYETIYKGKFDTIYHEHVSSFTAFSLKKILEKSGMCLHYAKKINSQGGSLRILAKKNSKSNQWNKILNKEIKFGVDKISTYKKVSSSILLSIKNIKKKFNEISKYKNVILLGAPARGVVIANVCNLDSKKILYAIDDSKTKFSKFFPGLDIKVFSWDKLKKNYDSNFMLLSWNYENEIVRKLRKIIKKPKVLLPLPVAEIKTYN